MEKALLLCLVFIWISSATRTSANEHDVGIHHRKLACRNVGGRCIKKKTKCPGDLSSYTLPGKPYCKRGRRCCYPDHDKLACRNLGGRCIKKKRKCPGDLSSYTLPGKPYCKRGRRCCYPEIPTLGSTAPTCGASFDLARASYRIVHGANVTSPYVYSWQVGLAYEKDEKAEFFCGGSVITKFHILTAAHCFYKLPACRIKLPMQFYVGIASNLQNESKRVLVKGIEEKPVYFNNFNCGVYANDIAIIRLKIDLFEESIIPICLPSNMSEMFAGEDATVTGWGSIEGYNPSNQRPDPDIPNTLQAAIMPVLSNEVCESKVTYLDESMVCAATKEGFENPNKEGKAP